MTRFKRFISLVLTFAMILCMLPVGVFAEDAQISAVSAYERIEMEDEAEKAENLGEEPTPDVDGNLNINGSYAGAWLRYDNVDFGENGAKAVSVRYSGRQDRTAADAYLEIYVDSMEEGEMPIATVRTQPTGSVWKTYATASAEVTREVTGVHSVYVVMRGTDFPNSYGYIANLNWFVFEESDTNRYMWTASEDGMVSAEDDGYYSQNTLTPLDAYYQLNESVELEMDKSWVVEWKGSLDGKMLLSSNADAKAIGARNLYVRSNAVTLGERVLTSSSTAAYYNYGCFHSADTTQSHIYRLVNEIGENGSNTVKLYIDSVEVSADLDTLYVGGSTTATNQADSYTQDSLSDLYFSFSYLFESRFGGTETLDYLKVWEEYTALDAVVEQIDAIGEITLSAKTAVEAARAAYDALSEEEQAQVYNYAALAAAEETLAELAVDAVVEMIDALGDKIALSSKTAIEEARAAYDALTDEQKAEVTNYAELEAAEASLAALRDPYSVIQLESMDSYNTTDLNPYNFIAMGTEPSKDSDEGDTKTSVIKNTYDGAWMCYENVDFGSTGPAAVSIRYACNTNCAADAQVELRLGSVDGELVAAVKTPQTGAWDTYATARLELDAQQQEKLTGVQDVYLVLRGTTSSSLKYIGNYNWMCFEEAKSQTQIDQEAADAVTERIEAIGEVDLSKAAAVAGAREAYDALTEDQKSLISEETLKVLEDAETILEELEKEPVEESLTIYYDDRIEASKLGFVLAPEIENEQVTSTQVGSTDSDRAVIAYDEDSAKLIAVGVGTADVVSGNLIYHITVEPAPISLFLLIGQSNMEGNEGNQNQSIANEDGQVYSSYAPSKNSTDTLTADNGAEFIPESLTAEPAAKNDTGSNGGIGSSAINALTESGAGKSGMDSGIAYEWTKLTGEKVWLVNAAHSGSDITTWQPGADNYKEAVGLFSAAQATMKNEIAAGHYTLSHMGYFWCQGCTNSTNTAKEYVDYFTAMHEGLKEELAFDFGSGEQTMEFANMILVRASTKSVLYRDGIYDSSAWSHTNYWDLRMSGPRVAQYYMSSSNEETYADVHMVSNIGDQWLTMPDGTDSVEEFFAARYPNGIDYPTQNGEPLAPKTPADMHDTIHYNQVGYNEIGIESARNAYYILNPDEAPEEETSLTLYGWDGHTEIADQAVIRTGKTGYSGSLVVPVVAPVYKAQELEITTTGNADVSYYDVLMTGGTESTVTYTLGSQSTTVLLTQRTMDPYAGIQMEDYAAVTAEEGLQGKIKTEVSKDGDETTKTPVVANTFDGAWLRYDNVVFGDIGPDSVSIRFATRDDRCYADSRVEIRLGDKDGTLVATVETGHTGGWDKYKTATLELNAQQQALLTGTKDICLVLHGTATSSSHYYAGNFNWFSFTEGVSLDEADQKAAGAVIDLIDAIGDVTEEDSGAISDARAAYNALTETQQTLVENYGVLLAAEGKLHRLTREEEPIVLVSASDFQQRAGHAASGDVLTGIVETMQAYGISKVDQFLFGGDFSNNYTAADSEAGIAAMMEILAQAWDLSADELCLIQGNHDPAATSGLMPSGDNDPASGEYGLFVINEDDYAWGSSKAEAATKTEENVLQTAKELEDYLNEKLWEDYAEPIFVISHLPLHYCMRTYNDGDGKYAKYLFDVLNEAADGGLNIIFLYGHNHSQSFDNYHGGGAVFYSEGDSILIADPANQTKYTEETIQFTYLNAGYLGRFDDVDTADPTNTAVLYEIYDDYVEITRFDANGIHDLKSAGVQSQKYGTEASLYEPNTRVETSPQRIALTEPRTNTVTHADTGIAVTALDVTGLDVSLVEGEMPEGYSAYVSYAISAEGYVQGKKAIVKIPVADPFEASRAVVVLNEEGKQIPLSISDGAVTLVTDQVGTIAIAQRESAASAKLDGDIQTVWRRNDSLVDNETYLLVSNDLNLDGTVNSDYDYKAITNATQGIDAQTVTALTDEEGTYITSVSDEMLWTAQGAEDKFYLTNGEIYLLGGEELGKTTDISVNGVHWDVTNLIGMYVLTNFETMASTGAYVRYSNSADAFVLNTSLDKTLVEIWSEAQIGSEYYNASIDTLAGEVMKGSALNTQIGAVLELIDDEGNVSVIPVTLENLVDAQDRPVTAGAQGIYENLKVVYNGGVVTDDFTLTVAIDEEEASKAEAAVVEAQAAVRQAEAAAEKANASAQAAQEAAEEAQKSTAKDKSAARTAADAAKLAQEQADAAFAAVEKAKAQAQAAADAAWVPDAAAAKTAAALAQIAADSAESAAKVAELAETSAAAAKEAQKAQQEAEEDLLNAEEAAAKAEEAKKAAEEACEAAEAAQKSAQETALKGAKYQADVLVDTYVEQVDQTAMSQTQIGKLDETAANAKDAIGEAETVEQIEAILAQAKDDIAAIASVKNCPSEGYTDVAKDAWYHEYVDYMIENGYMKGVSDNKFDVDGTVTRGQLVTILYRVAGEPSVEGLSNPFTDVSDDEWYANAIIWAAGEGIVKGVSDTEFAPTDEITRQQIVTILYRYDGEEPARENHLESFTDAGEIAGYAKNAMNWAIDAEIMNGVTKTTLSPADNATRAQICTIMMRYLENDAKN